MVCPQLNPVGWSYTESDREWLVETCKQNDVRIISDEVYSGADRNWKPFFFEGDNCVSISSLTKVHGLGQIRYGWIIASKNYCECTKHIPQFGRNYVITCNQDR